MFLFMMMLWSFCLAYFFGFFGISFVDKEALEESPSSFGLNELDAQLNTINRQRQQANNSNNSSTKSSAASSTSDKKPVAPISLDRTAPRHDTVICSDPKPIAVPAPVTASSEPEPDYQNLTNEEILPYLLDGTLKDYLLEKKLGANERAVSLRRSLYETLIDKKLDTIPYTGYDYAKVSDLLCLFSSFPYLSRSLLKGLWC
jgi:hypothetical protein